MSKMLKLLDQIITVEDQHGDFTPEQKIAFVINTAVDIKDRLRYEQWPGDK